MNQFQESIHDLMNEHKLNRVMLAKAVGVTSTTINGFFNYDYYPQIELAIKLSNYFD